MLTKPRKNRALLRRLGILVIPIVLMAYTLLLIAVVLSEKASSARVLVMLVLFGQVGIGLLILMFYLIRPDMREHALRYMRAHEITQQIAPDAVPVPEISPDEKVSPGREMPRRVKYSMGLALVAVFVLAWVGVHNLLELAGIRVPENIANIAGFLASILFLITWEGFQWWYTRQEPVPWRRVVPWIGVGVSIMLGMGLPLLILLERYVAWVFDLFDGYPLLAGTVVFLGGVVMATLVAMSIMLPALLALWGVLRALRRIDYDTALRRATWHERWLRSSTMKALVLAHMARYSEAEAAARHSLRFAKSSLNLTDHIDRGWLLEVLSVALMGLERWEEAEAGFKGAIELSTWDSDRRTSLAEVYLRRGIEPEKALRWAAEAVNNRFPSFFARLGMRYASTELYANHAWALALAGCHVEAQAELGRALMGIDRELPLVRASLCYRAGQVHRLGGADAAASDYFEQSAAIDPDGSFGVLARVALDSLSQDK